MTTAYARRPIARMVAAMLPVVVVVACAGDDASDQPPAAETTEPSVESTVPSVESTAPSTESTVPAADGTFSVEPAETFMTVGGRDHLVDVYVPGGSGPWPVAVVFHGRSGAGKNSAESTTIAAAAAAAGMLVFAPTWYVGDPFPLGVDDDEHRRAVGNCAVAFALAHAGDHDGDPTRVVVYGFSAGTGPALMAALDPAEDEIPGCRSSPTGAPVAGAVVGDGETFWHSAALDGAFREDLGAMQDSVASLTDPTRWPPDLDAEFFLWAAAEGTAPRDVADPGNPTWLDERDPTGSIRADLERLDQLADGVVSYVDAAQLLEVRLREGDVDVTLEIMPGGHTTDDKLPLLVGWLLDASS